MSKIISRGGFKISRITGQKLHFGPVVECDCGNPVKCNSSWANECPDCHIEYNGAGQQLASRSQWGEETGESF